MNSHRTYRLGKWCILATAVTAPVPALTCLAEGRAGLSALLPLGFGAAAVALTASHGTNVLACKECTRETVETLQGLGIEVETPESFDFAWMAPESVPTALDEVA